MANGLLTTSERRLASAVAALLVVAAWYLTLAPTSVGGPTLPVLVQGTSMEPTWHTGDLVVFRRASEYRIGDVVAYRPEGKSVVIHRIVAGSAEGWATQGDNFPWVDPWEPTSEEILGRAAWHLPAVGQAIVRLRDPVPLALTAAVLGMLAALAAPSPTADRVGGRLQRRSDLLGDTAVAGLLAAEVALLVAALVVVGMAASLTVDSAYIGAKNCPFPVAPLTPLLCP